MADPKPFNELAQTFDPNMPADQFAATQRKYFDTFVVPRLDHGTSTTWAWERFKKNTDRPDISVSQKFLLAGKQAAAGVLAGATGALKPIVEQQAKFGGAGAALGTRAVSQAEQSFETQQKRAARYGMSSLPGVAGQMVGMAPYFSMVEGAAGALMGRGLAGTATKLAIEGEKIAKGETYGELAARGLAERFPRTERLLTPGVAFATYDAATAKEGERLTAGLKGFGTGLAWGAGGLALSGALGLPGKLRRMGVGKLADQIKRNVLAGVTKTGNAELDAALNNPAVQTAVADSIENDVKTGQWEGRPRQIIESPTHKGVSVMGNMPPDAQGNRAPFTVRVRPGMEEAALKDVKTFTNRNGVVEAIVHGTDPVDVETMRAYTKASAEANMERYELSSRVQRTGEGQEENVAAELRIDGKDATAVEPNRVVVQDKVPDGPPSDEQIMERLGRLTTEDGNSLVKGHQRQMLADIKMLWDKKVGEPRKERIAESLSNWNLTGIIPKRFERPKVLLETEHVEPREEPSEIEQVRQAEIAEHEPEQRFEEGLTSEGPRAKPGFRRGQEMTERMSARTWQQALEQGGVIWAQLGGKLRWWYGDVEHSELFDDMRIPRSKQHEVPRGRVSAAGTAQTGETTVKLQHYGHEEFTPEEVVRNLRGKLGEGYTFRDVPEPGLRDVWKGFEDVDWQAKAGEAAVRASIPDSEHELLESNPVGQIGVRTRRVGIKVSKAEMDRLVQGAGGLTYRPGALGKVLNKLNLLLGLTSKEHGEFLRELREQPTHVYTPKPTPEEFEGQDEGVYESAVAAWRDTQYHEGLHVDFYHVDTALTLVRSTRAALGDVAQRLKRFEVYRNDSEAAMNEEAFVHVATAIRTGNVVGLSEYVRMDGTPEDLFAAVHGVAEDLREATKWEADDNMPARVLSRKMDDLLRRTDIRQNQHYELKMALNDELAEHYYDPNVDMWFRKTPQRIQAERDLKALFDQTAENERAHDYMPSASNWAEARGVRGPINERNSGPVKEPENVDSPFEAINGTREPIEPEGPEGPEGPRAAPRPPDQPSEPPKTRWSGWTAISSLFRPTGPWVADLDKAVNTALSKHGMKIPIFDRFKDVDEARAARDRWLEPHYDRVASILKGSTKQQQYAYFEVLMHPPQFHAQVGAKLGLAVEDMQRVKLLDDWMEDLQNEQPSIRIKAYLRDQLPRLRGSNYDLDRVYGPAGKDPSKMSTFERLIRKERLDPKSRHIGNLIDRALNEAGDQKFMNKPMAAFKRMIDQTAKNEQYVLGSARPPLENYYNYMKNVPDYTGQVMNKAVNDFLEFLGPRLAKANKYLPHYAQLPTNAEEFGGSRSVINKIMVLSYASGLGLRPAVPIRDTLQVFMTGLPVLGPMRFARGMIRGMTKEGWAFANEQGGLLGRHTIGDLYGDIFNEIPAGSSNDRVTRFANKLLAPSRWGHNIARSIVFNGEYESALEGVNAVRNGKMTFDELVKQRNSSLWWTDEAFQNRIKGQIADRGMSPEAIARNISLETLDLTLWPYRRGMQPLLLRTGAGRIFGQFGMWPMNYWDFLQRGARKFGSHPDAALRAVATWSAVNYAATSAMNGMGADQGKWFWFSPAGMDMSPHAKLIENMMIMMKDSPEGRDAKRQVLEYPLNFLPAGVAGANMLKAAEGNEPFFDMNGHATPSFLRVLGFTPLKEEPYRDLEDQLLYDVGMTRTAAGDIVPTMTHTERRP